MPRWVEHESEDDTASTSGEDEDQLGQAPPRLAAKRKVASPEAGPSSNKKVKLSISLSRAKQECHVCGQKGHCAGFVGSVYQDCPNKPCYLCKQPGHTTMTCPYRTASEHGCTQAASISGDTLLRAVQRRELNGRDNIVLSGDKKGQVAIWDHAKVYDRTVYNLNKALTNNLRFLPGSDGMQCCSASSDGTLKSFDIESGCDTELLNLNPDDWIEGVSNERNWRMLYGMDVSWHRNLILAGDSHGIVHAVDPRANKPIVGNYQLHKKGNKVNSVHVNPVDSNLMVSSSNDWTVRLNDVRMLSAAASDSKGKGVAGVSELACLDHPRLVNAAYFSPQSGSKLMSTCIDNRVRVWDYLHSIDKPCDREIVHSHDFNRYLTPFRAEWDPKDPHERLLVVGRYISEDFGGVALHPIDLLDASTGKQVAQLTDPNLVTICPVNKPHPRQDIIISGSSRSLYAWKPATQDNGGVDNLEVAATSSAASGDTFVLAGSANYVFFDADEAANQKQQKKKGKGKKA
ncbi:MAG: DAMAGED DNA-BINDING 2 protein [Trebouxia sp. A1-2]|nr:MAG: DAMAGED DNA-BINDING 2 protein [Trebouxia sp. A1-2]